jgi:hypothetical protein
MRSLAIAAVIWMAANVCIAADTCGDYDFRSSEQYAALSDTDREALEAVHSDLMLLWGALDMYADEHGHKGPDTLEQLVPHYLRELPRDPFASEASAAEDIKPRKPSCGGWGYRYQPTGTQAWVISSVGLPRFPYLAKEGNIGLYRAKGDWYGGLLFYHLATW